MLEPREEISQLTLIMRCWTVGTISIVLGRLRFFLLLTWVSSFLQKNIIQVSLIVYSDYTMPARCFPVLHYGIKINELNKLVIKFRFLLDKLNRLADKNINRIIHN